MHRHDGGSLRGDGGFDFGRIEVEGVRIDIGEYWFDPVPQQRVSGGNEGVGGGDDFASHTQCLQRSQQCNGAVVEQRHVLDAKVVT
ncbi:hypothetical protein D3C85_1481110 [compost metagenome]